MQVNLINNRAVLLSNLPSIFTTEVSNIRGSSLVNGVWYVPAMFPFSLDIVEWLNRGDVKNHYIQTQQIKEFIDKVLSTEDLLKSSDIDQYVPILKPYEHQLQALSLAIHMPRVGLFLDPGLGKTKIACDLMRYLHSSDKSVKVLVLALKVNMYTWVKEMESNSDKGLSLVPIVNTTKKNRQDKIQQAYASSSIGLVLTYDTAKLCVDFLKTLKFSLIVADESHCLRTPTSDRTKKILELVESPNSPNRRLILSGTPSLGNPIHLWGQLRFLGKFIVPDYWKFRNRYLVLSSWNSNIVLGSKNIDELSSKVSEVSLRRKAEECLDLPERTIQVIEIDPTPEIKSIYNDLVQYREVHISGTTIRGPENALTAMTKAAQVCSGFVYSSNKQDICKGCSNLDICAKLNIKPYTKDCQVEQEDPGRETIHLGGSPVVDSVAELVESHIQSGQKVIVWAKHREALDILYSRLQIISKVYRYDHTTEILPDVEEQFNNSQEPVIILGQIAYGIGVTFKAPVMIYAELSFSLDHWLQSLDRNYGLRAKGFSRLLVQVVVIKDSLASSTLNLLQNKISVSDLLTKRPSCITCDNAVSCIAKSIEPFSQHCIYKDTANKVSIPLKEI